MDKKRIVAWLIVGSLTYALGFFYLQQRDFSGMDCKRDTKTTLAEDNCFAHQRENDYNRGYIYIYDGVKLVLSPAWVPFRGLGELINK